MNIGNIVKNGCSSIKFRDEEGIVYEVNSKGKNSFIELKQNVARNEVGVAELSLSIRNRSDRILFIDSASVLEISVRLKGVLDIGGNINSWTTLSGGLGVGVKDLCNPCHNENKLDYYSPYYTLVGNRVTSKYAFFGFTTFGMQNSSIELKAVEGFKFESLRAICDFCGAPLAPGKEFTTEILYVNVADKPICVMGKYIDIIAPENNGAQKEFKDVIGWATWDYYQSKITEKDIMENVEWLLSHRDRIPVEYIQLDHGFQQCEGDWLQTNENFSHDLKWLASRIKEKGFKAGLWLCPFLIAPQSKVYQEHPDWVIKNAAGNPLEVSGYAVKTVYALDCSVPAVCDWIRELARTVTVDYGYEYIKLDGANAQGMSPLGILADPEVSKGKAMREGLKAFKEGMKEGAFLLNACLFGISLGVVDGMRVGDDVGARWDASKIAKHHGERDTFNGCGEVLRSIAATMNHFYQHKKLWINDPDYLVVRQKGSNSELSYEEAQSWASIVGLSNGLVMLGDKMSELQEDRIQLIEKILPHYKNMATPLDFFRKNVPSFYILEVRNSNEKWHVACIINVDYPAREREYTLVFKDIGLDGCKGYHVFDFWESRYQGTFSGNYNVKLQPHCCQVVAIREDWNVPQVLSTDIHISQGGLEIESSEFANNTLNIKTTDMDRAGNVFILVPEDYTPPKEFVKHSGNVWKCHLKLDGKSKGYGVTRR